MAFENLDLEEQEQLAALKAWWKDNGGLVLLVAAAAVIALAGWRGWQWYQGKQAAQASVLYEALQQATGSGDARVVHEAGGALIEKYPRTLYASMGALVSARFDFDQGDLKNAEAQLRWALEHARSEELRDIARLRLAAVLLDRKEYAQALRTLDAQHEPAFDALYAALKGDILVAEKQPAQARAAYQLALQKADPKDEAFRASVQMRLDALGG
ncbi:MAG: tetratricopeptide repeat protein [Betaproteobacteria bacterium]|nr:tetratricopeptide repeat protein [Betaproteobacteria bacterium]